MKRKNTTFIGSEPSWANACVGNNGNPGYWEYAKGFSQAATILIDLVLHEGAVRHSVDEMIYPVCFNMRHSVELRLKGAIEELIRIEKIRSRNLQFDFVGSHDIGNIWHFFASKSQLADDRYEPIIKRLDAKISDIAAIDPTGQTFRYPLSSESQKHLVDVSLINFRVLKLSFIELEAALDELHHLNQYLRNEYQCGSYTNLLSRKNLFEIASVLPPRESWADQVFVSIKEDIKKRFNISSNELSKSIKIIQSHYELAPRIEISIPLLGIEEGFIEEFFGHWFKLHDLPCLRDSIETEDGDWCTVEILESIVKSSQVQAEVWNTIKSELSPEKLAGVSALFYFAHELEFAESYIRFYSLDLEEAKLAFASSEQSFKSQFLHLFKKTNAVCNILKSLYFLYKKDFAEQLVSAYGLDDKFSWLDDARTRVLFRKPNYCGYDTSEQVGSGV